MTVYVLTGIVAILVIGLVATMIRGARAKPSALARARGSTPSCYWGVSHQRSRRHSQASAR